MINAKRLHIHSLPLLAFAVIATSTIAASVAALSYATNGTMFLQAAFHPVVKAIPAKGVGTAKVELNNLSNPSLDTPVKQQAETSIITPEVIPDVVDNTDISSPASALNLGEATLLQASVDTKAVR